MKKAISLLFLLIIILANAVSAFSLDSALTNWVKGTISTSHYVNISQISTPYGDGVSVNTFNYPGAYELGYDFFAYYNETFIVPPTGRILVNGYFSYNDVTPHPDRKYLAVYFLTPDLSGYLVNATRILDYTRGDNPGVWYFRSRVVSGLTPGEKYRIAFGRGDLCDMDRRLEASWTGVEITSCRILEVPNDYPSIQQAIDASSAGDEIQVAAGTYPEHLVVNKDTLNIIGQGSGVAVVDAGRAGEPISPAIYVTGKDVLLSGFTVRNSLLAEGIVVYGEGVDMVENEIWNCTVGVEVFNSDGRIVKNSIHDNLEGIWMESNVENCTLYHNSLFNNTQHVYLQPPFQGASNWTNGCEGNYWDNSTTVDSNGDGIVDNPYVINPINIDNCPLMSRYLRGDVNHDGKVDVRDVARVAKAFGSYPGHASWNPHADINEDLKIDVRDVAATCIRFGSHL
ncbi:dockerin type I domain-containing protein [Candidatus Bathyarchaeota archaeon]|nr:dockerin type I domain-containing protein [Candidatus Bathyarchaeota archaeon]